MRQAAVNDLDYLAARLHGRRSRLVEGERLDGLCRLPNLAELGRVVHPEVEFPVAADFQRRLAEELVREMSGFVKHLERAAADLLAWMQVRFQLENIKVLLRSLVQRTREEPGQYLLSLPPSLALDVPALRAAVSLEGFVERLPAGTPRKSLWEALDSYRDQPRPFYLEAALDCGYFRELLIRTDCLLGEDLALVKPIVWQEVDAFHLMLAVRGRFHYALPPEMLMPLHVRGSGIPSARFGAMLAAPDILTAASFAVGRAIDALPAGVGTTDAATAMNAAALEALVWKRFLQLSNRAFRWSHMGLGAVVGYVGIRRVEVANLITLSEGLRCGATESALRDRLIPQGTLEAAHV